MTLQELLAQSFPVKAGMMAYGARENAKGRLSTLAGALGHPADTVESIGNDLSNWPPLRRPEGDPMNSELGQLAQNFGMSPITFAGMFIGKGAKTLGALQAAVTGEKNAISENAGTYTRPDNAGRGGPVQGYPITREQADAINAARPGSAARRWTRGPDTRGDEGWFLRHGVSPFDETLIYGIGDAPNSSRSAFSPELQAMISEIKAGAATPDNLLRMLVRGAK